MGTTGPEPQGAQSNEGHRVGPLMLFDGVCNLCTGTVQWVIDRDPSARFTFASLQWESARQAVRRADPNIDFDSLPDSIVLIDTAGVHTQSTAALRIARGLGFPYSLLGLGLIVPRPLRNWVYDFIARRRYQWFGHQDTCMVPTPELEARFLDAGALLPTREHEPLGGTRSVDSS